MDNQAFSKLWIVIILVIAGGFLAWQYFEKHKEVTPKEESKNETTDWEIYENKEFGFKLKYPPILKLSSTGPNSEQQKLERGETISGTIQPSYDIIIFSDKNDKEQFRIEIFHPYEKAISEKNYKEDYLYLYGSCDLRWGFEPTVVQIMKNHSIEILEVKGKFLGPGMKTPTFGGCYYFKNYSNNLIVLSTNSFENQSGFEKIDSMVRNILLTLSFLPQKSEGSNTAPSITIISPNGGEKWVLGRVYNITWTSRSIDKVKITLVNYGYYLGENSTVPLSYEIASGVSANLDKYEKYIHPNIKIGDKYKIKIESCSEEECYSDESDNYFTIN